MTRLVDIENIAIPRSIAARTVQHLRECGERGLEGMAFWTGRIAPDGRCQLADVYVPEQLGERTEHGLVVMVDGDELHRLNIHLDRNGTRLIAQIHSHPGRAYHSAWDDAYAVVTQLGGFSIVVPDFAFGAFAMERFAVYRLTPPWLFRSADPHWRLQRPRQVREMFTLEMPDGGS